MYKCEIVKMSELDNYEKGCDPATFRDYGVIDTVKASSISELVKKVKASWDLKDAEMSDESISICVNENDVGMYPNNQELAAFKRGELNLYNVNYVFYFSEVTQTEIFPSVMLGFFK